MESSTASRASGSSQPNGKFEQIHPAELAYHQQVLADMKRIEAIVNSWQNHLARQYNLAHGDLVDTDGRIHRHEPARDST